MTREDYLTNKEKWEKRYNELMAYYIEELQATFHNFRIFQEELHMIYENTDNKTRIRKKRILFTFRNQEKYVERKINEIGIEIGPMTKNRIECMFDYDIALLRTYATGIVYDENNHNIFK